MAKLTLIQLHLSPYSERLRWVLDTKGLQYEKREYQPLAGEDELRRSTGISTVPVLLADGEVVGDSDVAVAWLEQRHPRPELMPRDARLHAQARALEITATEMLAPAGRLGMIGQWKIAGFQPLADHFAAKYGWSPDAEKRTGSLMRSFLRDVVRAVESGPYLVGDSFSRADLTVACMASVAVGAPPNELFELDDSMRATLSSPLGKEDWIQPLRRWRDEIYRRHRGRRVTL